MVAFGIMGLMLVSGMLLITNNFAKADENGIPKPSAPEFTIKLVDRSYDVPLTYTNQTDPYTGKMTTIVNGGYRISNRTMELWIRNQEYAPSEVGGISYALFYNVTFKGHYTDKWQIAYADYSPRATNSEYTVLILGYGTERGPTFDMPQLGELVAGSQIDIRLQALIGTFIEAQNPPSQFGEPYHYEFVGEKSSWSNTETINIPALISSSTPSTSPSDNPKASGQTDTQTLSYSGFNLTEIALFASLGVIGVILTVITLMHRRKIVSRNVPS